MKVSILGTRGIPASHGGFETFTEHLALYLSERGHQVTVYCQNYSKEPPFEDQWMGIRRVILHGSSSPTGTIAFDWAAARHACKESGVILTLGYNTAILSILHRIKGNPTIMNMDGIEWRRDKWSLLQRLWLRLNERAGAALSNHLIADHPEIGTYLSGFASPAKISMIPYESEPITCANPTLIQPYGLAPDGYVIVIARGEPENSLLEIVQAFSCKPRGIKLVILGNYFPQASPYHSQVIAAAGPEVIFAGAIYDKNTVRALRFFARAYIHGHKVGGTNPSLVESLAAGNPIIAHDNRFTRWVAGPQQQYFSGTEDLKEIFDHIFNNRPLLDQMAVASRCRHQEAFTPGKVLPLYESLLQRFADAAQPSTIPDIQLTKSRTP